MRGLSIRIFLSVLIALLLTACANQERNLQVEINHHVVDESELADADHHNTLRVMTLNVAHARGIGVNQMLQGARSARTNLGSIASLLRHEAPDIASLQEVDRQSFWNGNFNHVSFIAEQGAFQQSVSGAHVRSMGLDYGTALLARLDMNHSESITFNPSEASGPKGFVVSTINWPGKECIEVDVVSLHLDFASKITRREQAAEMIAVLKKRHNPVILMGDFNADWRSTDSAVRQLAEALQLQPFQPHDQALITFPKHKRRLDWILVSPGIRFQSYQVVETVVSDHLGVVSDLSINRSCG